MNNRAANRPTTIEDEVVDNSTVLSTGNQVKLAKKAWNECVSKGAEELAKEKFVPPNRNLSPEGILLVNRHVYNLAAYDKAIEGKVEKLLVSGPNMSSDGYNTITERYSSDQILQMASQFLHAFGRKPILPPFNGSYPMNFVLKTLLQVDKTNVCMVMGEPVTKPDVKDAPQDITALITDFIAIMEAAGSYLKDCGFDLEVVDNQAVFMDALWSWEKVKKYQAKCGDGSSNTAVKNKLVKAKSNAKAKQAKLEAVINHTYGIKEMVAETPSDISKEIKKKVEILFKLRLFGTKVGLSNLGLDEAFIAKYDAHWKTLSSIKDIARKYNAIASGVKKPNLTNSTIDLSGLVSTTDTASRPSDDVMRALKGSDHTFLGLRTAKPGDASDDDDLDSMADKRTKFSGSGNPVAAGQGNATGGTGTLN